MNKLLHWTVAIVALLAVACEKNESGETGSEYGALQEGALVATGVAEDITPCGAELLGCVNIDKLLGIDYELGMFIRNRNYVPEGHTLEFEMSDPKYVERITTNSLFDNKFKIQVGNKWAEEEYAYRSYLKVGDQYYFGDIKFFKTPGWDLNIKTGQVEKVMPTSALIKGSSYNDLEIQRFKKRSSIGFVFDVVKDTGGKDWREGAMSMVYYGSVDNSNIDINLSVPFPDSEYRCCFCVTVDGKRFYGQESQFRTPELGLTLNTDSVSEVKANSVVLHGSCAFKNVPESYGMGFVVIPANMYSESTVLDNWVKGLGVITDGRFSLTVSDLMEHTNYYYCCYAYIGGQYYFGKMKSFTTLGEPLS